jgi:hypothetical protein
VFDTLPFKTWDDAEGAGMVKAPDVFTAVPEDVHALTIKTLRVAWP